MSAMLSRNFLIVAMFLSKQEKWRIVLIYKYLKEKGGYSSKLQYDFQVLFPAYFALVMATGIIGSGAGPRGIRWLSLILFRKFGILMTAVLTSFLRCLYLDTCICFLIEHPDHFSLNPFSRS
jgi:hypothetical protein